MIQYDKNINYLHLVYSYIFYILWNLALHCSIILNAQACILVFKKVFKTVSA